jgi:hypothetical protein
MVCRLEKSWSLAIMAIALRICEIKNNSKLIRNDKGGINTKLIPQSETNNQLLKTSATLQA